MSSSDFRFTQISASSSIDHNDEYGDSGSGEEVCDGGGGGGVKVVPDKDGDRRHLLVKPAQGVAGAGVGVAGVGVAGVAGVGGVAGAGVEGPSVTSSAGTSWSYTISDLHLGGGGASVGGEDMLSVEVLRGAAAGGGGMGGAGGDTVTDSCLTNHPTAFALHYCKRKILQPYFTLLAMLGWRPWFTHIPVEHQCYPMRSLNLIYPLLVLTLMCGGYMIQLMARFRRDRSVYTEPLLLQPALVNPNVTTTSVPTNSVTGVTSVPTNSATGVTSVPTNQTSFPLMMGAWPSVDHLVSIYVVPDLLHLAAYCYIFYLFRVSRCENLQTLMETVFLQTNPSHSGFLAQKRLIRLLRWYLYTGCVWVLLSCISQLLHVFAQPIHFYTLHPDTVPSSRGVHYTLLVIMMVGVLVLDCVYMSVVLSYCVQCQLIIVLMRSVCEQIRECSTSLVNALKDISECGRMIEFLNHHTATAVSLLMFNFATMVILGVSAILDEALHITLLMYISTLLIILLWSILLLAPLIQAVRVSGQCRLLRRLGHEVRVRPFGYQETSPADLDSFLLYTTTLTIHARLFCMPVRSSCLCGLLSALAFTMLLLSQLDVINL